MTFGEAIDQWKMGKVVARRSSPQAARNYGIGMSNHNGKCVLWFCGPTKEGNRWWGNSYTPTDADIFADDWEVMDA